MRLQASSGQTLPRVGPQEWVQVISVSPVPWRAPRGRCDLSSCAHGLSSPRKVTDDRLIAGIVQWTALFSLSKNLLSVDSGNSTELDPVLMVKDYPGHFASIK